ncbi:MAG TPA: sensor histidine kinase [Bryobacteraceae bacterium]|nr:sensor histidine kinase [Bryobacteraceae bacterium]
MKNTGLKERFRSPTARLLAGLAITLAVVAAFCFYALRQIAGLRDLQNQTIERNRKDSLQLLRTQNDLSALGLAMRDMLSGDEPYPLYAWEAQFARIHKDISDAIRVETGLTSLVDSPERQASFRRGLSQLWISTDQMFALARAGNEQQARALVLNSLEPQEASLVTAVSRLLVENNETQQKTAARVGAIYDRVENRIYWLFAVALAAIALTSLMLIRANRIVFHEMAQLSEQRSGLARKLITMQEEMFRSISRELHDEFGQMLTAIGTMLSRTRRQHCPPELTSDLDEIRGIAQDALDKTRSLTQTLHPAILDDGGLEEAIDWYLSVFEKQTGIHVALEKSGVSRELKHELGDDMPIHVYRVLQESLNNLAKHSQSISAWVRVRLSNELLELEVEDRGIGLEPESQGKSRGLGMIAMRERAQLLSGRIEFLRPEKGGTLVRLHVPLHPRATSPGNL